ncbi:hypothetical protein VTL71DRAFT_5665 [Oculimacula yallundae]|uniref:Mid2 domain-containing protein n=1 Tax=Oculimacula yallundae TaxID=86028 RepID=A0ABR4BY70_9HELO
MKMTAFVPLFICVISLASAQFLNPPPYIDGQKLSDVTIIYHVGDTLDVRWNSTNGAVVDLAIGQAGAPEERIDMMPNSGGLAKGNYKWRITTDGSDGGSTFDLAFSNTFRFGIFEAGSPNLSFATVYFNISNSTIDQYGNVIARSSSSPVVLPISTVSSSAITSSSTSRTSTSSSSTAPEISATTTVSSTTAPSTTLDSENSSFGTGAKIGIGIGLGVFGLGVIVGLALWFLFLRKRNAEMSRTRDEVNVDQTEATEQQIWSPKAELDTPH